LLRPPPLNLETLVEAARSKRLDRAGWARRGVPRPESVAAHSWGTAWLALALCPPELDRGKAIAYAVLHDLAEVRVGDLTPADGVPADEKRRREAEAIAGLLADRPDLAALWRAYEDQVDAESRLVRQVDRLDMAIQALVYHRAGALGMAEFVESASAVIVEPELRALLEEIRREIGGRA
jgi:putative hydrolase of HD superfamily